MNNKIKNLHDGALKTGLKRISRKHSYFVMMYRPGSNVQISYSGGSHDNWEWIDRAGNIHALELVESKITRNDPFNQRRALPEFPANCVAVVNCGMFCGRPATPAVYTESGII